MGKPIDCSTHNPGTGQWHWSIFSGLSDADRRLVALADHAPHICEHEDCPGRQTQAKLDRLEQAEALIREMSEALCGVKKFEVSLLDRIGPKSPRRQSLLDALSSVSKSIARSIAFLGDHP